MTSIKGDERSKDGTKQGGMGGRDRERERERENSEEEEEERKKPPPFSFSSSIFFFYSSLSGERERERERGVPCHTFPSRLHREGLAVSSFPISSCLRLYTTNK
ncbi:unnamed protein product [Musa hybrid cultivar]